MLPDSLLDNVSVVFQFHLVDPGDAIQCGYLYLRRDPQVHPPPEPRGLGRDGDLLLSTRKSLQRCARRTQMAAQRLAIWWGAKRGLHIVLHVIWRDAILRPGRSNVTTSFFLYNAFVNNNNNKWITHIIPVRWNGDSHLGNLNQLITILLSRLLALRENRYGGETIRCERDKNDGGSLLHFYNAIQG